MSPRLSASALLLLAACATAPTPAPLQPLPGPKPAVDDLPRASAELQAGRALLGAGQHDQALQHFATAAQLAPGSPLGHLEEAQCRMALDQPEAQVAAPLQRAVAVGPDNPRVAYVEGLFHENFGRDDQARGAYLRALARRASYPDALYRLASLEERRGDGKAARARYEQALRLSPDNPGVALGAARLAEADGDWARAAAVYRGLVDRQPENAGLQRKLVEALKRSGRSDEARRLQAQLEAAARGEQRQLRPLRPSKK